MPRALPMPADMAPTLIRTDFSDDAGWEALVDDLLTERFIEDISETMAVYVAPLNDRQYETMTMEELLAMVPNYHPPDDAADDFDSGERHFPGEPARPLHAYIVDDVTFGHPERPILAVNFYLTHGKHFRITAEGMAMTEANLSIANLGFNDYMDAAGPDGIVRF